MKTLHEPQLPVLKSHRGMNLDQVPVKRTAKNAGEQFIKNKEILPRAAEWRSLYLA
jgi:hypothetical protein